MQTRSSVIMAALNVMDTLNGGLWYEYEVAPAGSVKNQPRAVGTAHLRYPDDGTTIRLAGSYYNEPQEVDAGWIRHHGDYTLTKA